MTEKGKRAWVHCFLHEVCAFLVCHLGCCFCLNSTSRTQQVSFIPTSKKDVNHLKEKEGYTYSFETNTSFVLMYFM